MTTKLFIFIDMKNRIHYLTIVFIFFTLTCEAQSKVQKYVNDATNQHRWLKEYVQFLSIPNVLADSVNILRNANHISNMLTQLGVKSELLLSGKPNSAPVVFGNVNVPGATTTLAFYAHYDGQPVNPKQWAEGLQPFVPALFSDRLDKGGAKIPFPTDQEKIEPNWRLYARGSSDDKAGVFSIITAYETLIKFDVYRRFDSQFNKSLLYH